MSNIPTKQDQASNNVGAAAQQAAATRAIRVKDLTDALIAAINAGTQSSVTVRGVYAPDVVAEVAAAFAKSGWTLTQTNQALNQATFKLS